MSEQSLTITIASEDLDPGQGGAVWVRLEPEAAQGDVATVAQAAAVIDELFQLEPCAGGLGTGGLEVEVGPAGTIEPPVEEQQFDQVTKHTLGIGVCQAAAAGWSWEAQVRVLRSHPERPYVFRCDRGEVIATERVDEEVRMSVLFADANTASLEMPVAGSVSGGWGSVVTRSGPAPAWRISGATVNLDRRATGQLNLVYRTVYDLVTVRVSGRGEERQQAVCLCFYERLVADCTLEPPEIDERDLARLQCGSTGSLEDDGGGECYELVRSRVLCECSGDVYSEVEVERGVPCPPGAPPGRHFVGSRSVNAGWVYCPEERDDSLFDPEYQMSVCCRTFTPSLPCVKQTRPLQPTRGLEHGPDFYRALYGERVRLIGLTPPEGDCGDLVLEYRRISRDCCDLAEPVQLPEEMVVAPGMDFSVTAVLGVPPLSWQGDADLVLQGVSADTRSALFRATDGFCGSGSVSVTDECDTSAAMPVRSTEGRWIGFPVDHPCQALDGFAAGAADDAYTPSGPCISLTPPRTRTTGQWRVLVSFVGPAFFAACPELPEGCGRRYITFVRGLNKDPLQAICERFQCFNDYAAFSEDCCTSGDTGSPPRFAAMYEALHTVQRWEC